MIARTALALLGSLSAIAGGGETVVSIRPLFQGVVHREHRLEKPRPVRIHEVRIDTRAAGISFFTTPGNGDAEGEVDGRRTTTFLKEFGMQVAINGTGFGPVTTEGKPVDVIGLSISDGRTISTVDRKRGSPVFLATRDRRVRVLGAPFPKHAFDGADNALQGWYGADGMLVDDGVVRTAGRDIHPRSAVGVAKDGRFVHLVVADGRQPGFSEGMTLVELAEWMKGIGCRDAMNLDGGGSSTLVVMGAGSVPRILNSPSGKSQRSVGNHLGVRALPLSPP